MRKLARTGEDMWSKVLNLYEGYIGTGMIAGLFLVAVIYLFVTEKNKNTRILFLYMPVIVLGLYFCPIFAAVVYSFVGEEIYYRLLWLVPTVPVLAYAAVKITMGCNGKKRLVAGASIGAILLLSGSLVYQSPYFSKAENAYHVPETVVKICDAIEVEGREVRAAFPMEFLQYVRQYSPYVCMPYGREMVIERWNFNDALFDLLGEDTLNVEQVVEKARERQCHYVIFSVEKELDGRFEDYDYELFDEIDGYVIYTDTTLYKGL